MDGSAKEISCLVQVIEGHIEEAAVVDVAAVVHQGLLDLTSHRTSNLWAH